MGTPFRDAIEGKSLRADYGSDAIRRQLKWDAVLREVEEVSAANARADEQASAHVHQHYRIVFAHAVWWLCECGLLNSTAPEES